MFSLPFVSTPYPDEIAGSWLRRNELHNGQGAWRVLWKDVGGTTDAPKIDFDMADYAPPTSAFLRALGTEYEQVLLELTTLPYWLLFGARSLDDGTLPGTRSLPYPYFAQRKGRITHLSYLGRQDRARCGPRYCPECLAEDVHKFGEPYWHRSHQLPNVYWCAAHNVRLRTACPNCGRTPLVGSARWMQLPRLFCSCGFDHRRPTAPTKAVDIWIRLATISRDALTLDWRLEGDTTRQFLTRQLRGRKISTVLENAYGSRYSARRYLAISDGNEQLFCHVRRWLSECCSREVCALMAAIRVDFQRTFTFQSDNEGRDQPSAYVVAPQLAALSTQTAKAALLEGKRTNCAFQPSRGTAAVHLWTLRILDPDWLFRHFPKTKRGPAPSLDDDRHQILFLLNRHPPEIKSNARQLVVQSVAGMRARIRDVKWLDERLRECDFNQSRHSKQSRKRREPKQNASQLANVPRRPRQTRASSSALHERRVAALKRALASALADTPPPSRITIALLAERAGLSWDTARGVIRYDQRLQTAMRGARKDLALRRLTFALAELAAQRPK